jgi:two-component system response regulator MtrA
MDVSLPGMAPDEFCRLVRQPARASTSAPPVLLLGTDTRQGEVTAALNAGADDFIAMPFRAPELRCRVLGLLRRSVPPET